eukprot:m51a1_g6903 hypothetical protein (292) ;mRNA; r:49793-52586
MVWVVFAVGDSTPARHLRSLLGPSSVFDALVPSQLAEGCSRLQGSSSAPCALVLTKRLDQSAPQLAAQHLSQSQRLALVCRPSRVPRGLRDLFWDARTKSAARRLLEGVALAPVARVHLWGVQIVAATLARPVPPAMWALGSVVVRLGRGDSAGVVSGDGGFVPVAGGRRIELLPDLGSDRTVVLCGRKVVTEVYGCWVSVLVSGVRVAERKARRGLFAASESSVRVDEGEDVALLSSCEVRAGLLITLNTIGDGVDAVQEPDCQTGCTDSAASPLRRVRPNGTKSTITKM